MSEFPYSIYDAHHHLWDLEAVHYPWLAAKGVVRFFGDPSPIQINYLAADFLTDTGNLPVEKSIHVQVGADDEQHLLESQLIQSFANTSSIANGIVAFCALEQNDRNQKLDLLQALPNLRGVRQIVGRSIEEDKTSGTHSLINNDEWKIGFN